MKTRNNRRKLARETCIVLALFIAIVGGTLLFNANEQADGFVAYVNHDDYKRFINGKNILISRVHEESWDIFYQVHEDCPDSRKTEETYRILREHIEKAIRMWLAPLREITDRPIVNEFVFHKDKGHQHQEISFVFECNEGRSKIKVVAMDITMKEFHVKTDRWLTPDLPYLTVSLLHELGHAFDLADTYVKSGAGKFGAPSSGGVTKTIGNQPQSVMSSIGCRIGGEYVLCLDDKRVIQWLYRYHYEGLDPTDCPPEFVYEELVYQGRKAKGCVYKHPLITEVRQKHLVGASRLLDEDKELKINDKDKQGYTALHYLSAIHGELTDEDYEDYNSPINRLTRRILKYPGINLNITDSHGNTPLHWAVWWGIAKCRGVESLLSLKETKTDIQNKYGETALHYAGKLGRDKCITHLFRRKDLNPNIKESRWGNTPLHEAAKNGHTEVVKMLLAHQDINPNLRNDAGFTPLQLAMQGGAAASADSDASFQAQDSELWLSVSEEHRQQLLESSRLSPAALQQAHAEIAALLRAHPGIILPDASDVNGDGVVNILDLVKVSNAFGQRGPVPEDVNGDGIVNIQDLVWVSGAFGQ